MQRAALLICSLAAALACAMASTYNWVYNQDDAIAAGSACGSGYSVQCAPEYWWVVHSDCNGTSQSPINIAQATPSADLSALEFNKASSCKDLTLTNNGHSWKVGLNCDDAYTVTVDSQEFSLLQFHFHSPSENTIGGGFYDAEVHLVHYDEDAGEYLVVGVMIEASSDYGDNDFFDVFWGNSSFTAHGKDMTLTTSLDPYANVLPAGTSYYHWMGSFTTPDCTEGVHWYLMAEPIRMSTSQLDEMRAGIAAHPESQVGPDLASNRPTQPLYGRTVYQYLPGYYEIDSVESSATVNTISKNLLAIVAAAAMIAF